LSVVFDFGKFDGAGRHFRRRHADEEPGLGLLSAEVDEETGDIVFEV
jgi:hypothetical protein